MLRRLAGLFLLTAAALLSACKGGAPESEIRQDIKYLAVFTSPALTTQEDDKRFSAAFQSKYKSRVVTLRPVSGLAALSHLNARASLLAILKINHLREARSVCREIEVALGNGSLAALIPLVETLPSQDNFSGGYFYLALEKRAATFQKLNGNGKNEIFRNESEDFAKDRNMLSYFAASALTDTPYQTVHILGYSGVAETQFETFDGLFARAVRKLEAADTLIAEKIR